MGKDKSSSVLVRLTFMVIMNVIALIAAVIVPVQAQDGFYFHDPVDLVLESAPDADCYEVRVKLKLDQALIFKNGSSFIRIGLSTTQITYPPPIGHGCLVMEAPHSDTPGYCYDGSCGGNAGLGFTSVDVLYRAYRDLRHLYVWVSFNDGQSWEYPYLCPNYTFSPTSIAVQSCNGGTNTTVENFTLTPYRRSEISVDAGPDQEICAGQGVQIGSSAVRTYTPQLHYLDEYTCTDPFIYNWTPTTGLDDASVATPLASPATTTTYTVEVTDVKSGKKITDHVTVKVNPLPVVSFNPIGGPFSATGNPVILSGSPTGGYFTGCGVSGYQFDPRAVAPGVYTLRYWFTDGNGCTNYAEQDVEVNPDLKVGIQGPMYWTEDTTFFYHHKIRGASLDGKGKKLAPYNDTGRPIDIALDEVGGKVYWTLSEYPFGKIQRANLDGTGVETLPIQGIGNPFGIALDLAPGLAHGKVYWTAGNKIQRVSLNGGVAEDVIVGLASAVDIDLDVAGGKVYWSDNNQIQRANLDRTGKEPVISGPYHPYGIALDMSNHRIYWTDVENNKIQSANLEPADWVKPDGTVMLNDRDVKDLTTGRLIRPGGIAIDIANAKMYWLDVGRNDIWRANLNGTEPEPVIEGSKNSCPPIVPVFGIALSPDTDGDGLVDSWEEKGVDVDGDGNVEVDLPATGAKRMHKDIFVEVDALTGMLQRSSTALQDVVKAFEKAPVSNPDGIPGITLHASLDEVDGPADNWPDSRAKFERYRDGLGPVDLAHFGTSIERNQSNWTMIKRAKARIYRYCVFASTFDLDPNGNPGGSTGNAWTAPSDGFIVTLGLLNQPTAEEQAGTFMHELGHALGLEHGGGDYIYNFKPNYYSIMNYLWQMRVRVKNNACGGSLKALRKYQSSWRLDYSRQTLPPLDEKNLDEQAGIGGDPKKWVPVGPPPVVPPRVPPPRQDLSMIVPMGGPVNWDRVGRANSPKVQADVNYVKDCDPDPNSSKSPGDLLFGWDDWSRLQYALPPSATATQQLSKVSVEQELNELTVDLFLDLGALQFDCNLNGIPDEDDIASGHSLDANDDGIPDECEAGKCQSVPTADAGTDRNVLYALTTTLGGSPTASGGTGPYTYSWSPTTGLDNPAAANPKATVTSTTTYTVTVTDANHCTGTDQVVVIVQSFVLLSNGYLKINQNQNSAGDIHSNDKIEFQTGAPGTHVGNLTAKNDITIQSKNTIQGNATAGDNLYLFGTAKVTGTKQDHASVATIALPSFSFSAGGPNVTVPNSGSKTLAPGSYGTVNVKAKATLFLSAGDYYFNILDVDPNAILSIDASGPVNLYVVSDLQLDNSVQVKLTGGASDNVLFVSLQSPKLVVGSKAILYGTLILPNAQVQLAPDSKIKGAVYASSISIDPKVKFYHHTSLGTFPKESEASEPEVVVTSYQLEQNYPNPFNPNTVISFAIPEAGNVTLRIYSETGQLVKQLASGNFASGRHQISWDGRNESGQVVAAGVYLYRLVAHGENDEVVFTQTRRMAFVK